MNIVQILFVIPASIQNYRRSLMQHHTSVFPRNRWITFQLLPLPIVRLQIQTPKPNNMRISLMIFASKQIHHVIIDNSWVRIDVAERVIIQKMSCCPRPNLCGNVKTINQTLLRQMVLRLFLQNTSIDEQRWFMNDSRVISALNRLFRVSLLCFFDPISQNWRLDCHHFQKLW